MRSTAVVWHAIWFAGVAVLPVLLAIVVRRRFYRCFPIFSAYVAYLTVAGFTFIFLNYSPRITGNQYFEASVVDGALVTILEFAVIYELFAVKMRQFPQLRASGTTALRWATIFLLIIAIALAWLLPSRSPFPPMSIYEVLQRTGDSLGCGLLLFLFAFFAYFRLPWRSQEFGIALGLGILVSVNVAGMAIRSQIDRGLFDLYTDIYTIFTEGAELLSVCLWMFYVLRQEDVDSRLASPLPRHDLETWNQELQRFL
jgi:hypothetical protein